MQSASDLRERAQWLLEKMPLEVLQRVVSLLEVFWQELGSKSGTQADSQVDASIKQYDFSDLAGRLQWRGDAVQEQRNLRDEW